MNYQSLTIGVSFALFVVWMERKGRWTLFAGALAGDYQIGGTRGTISGTAPAPSTNTTPQQGVGGAPNNSQGVPNSFGQAQGVQSA